MRPIKNKEISTLKSGNTNTESDTETKDLFEVKKDLPNLNPMYISEEDIGKAIKKAKGVEIKSTKKLPKSYHPPLASY